MRLSDAQKKALREIATGEPCVTYYRHKVMEVHNGSFKPNTLNSLVRQKLVLEEQSANQFWVYDLSLTYLGKQVVAELESQ